MDWDFYPANALLFVCWFVLSAVLLPGSLISVQVFFNPSGHTQLNLAGRGAIKHM